MRVFRFLRNTIAIALFAGSIWAGNLDIDCGTGSISVRTQMGGGDSVRLSVVNPDRPIRPDDVTRIREAERHVVRCSPRDKSSVSLELVVPHTTRLIARTKAGAVQLEGLIRRAELRTDTGAVRVALPWQIATMYGRSRVAPKHLSVPELPRLKFFEGLAPDEGSALSWALGLYSSDDRRFSIPGVPDASKYGRLLWSAHPSLRGNFSEIWVIGNKLSALELIDAPVPEYSWIRDPVYATNVLPNLTPGPTAIASRLLPATPSSDAAFRSEVRLVTLSFPAWDQNGRPIAGLREPDFDIEEDGVLQKVAFVKNDDNEPLDVALVLDLGGRVIVPNLKVIKPSLRAFLESTQPHDRIAIYALSAGVFQVIIPLTSDRARLLRGVDEIPLHFMRSALYDAITLGYAQENLHRSTRRTAMVVLTHGSDLQHWRPTPREQRMLKNHRLGFAPGSSVQFDDLLAVQPSSQWSSILIVLPMINPTWKDEAADGAKRMEQLASATGGRMFQAHKPEDLSAACRDAALALRTVYAVSYYPKQTEFDGRWRQVTVRVNKPGVVSRTRSGYHAW